jgi:hypothetical protein
MAILKVKKMIEDLETGSVQVLSTLTIDTVTNVGYASTVGTAGVMALATSAANAGSSSYASTASRAGTSRVAHFASSGTANIAGTSAHWSTGGL